MKNLAFYETAAQVIPILFVVLALELRYFEPWTWPQSKPNSSGLWTRLGDTLIAVIMLGLVGAAEAGAFHVLDTGESTSWAHTLIVWALLVEAAGILALLLRRMFRDRPRASSNRGT